MAQTTEKTDKPVSGFVTYECDCTHDLGDGRTVKNRVVNEVEDVANPPVVRCDGCKQTMQVVEGAA